MTYEEVRDKISRRERLTPEDHEVLVEYVRRKIRRHKLDSAGHDVHCSVYTDLLDPHAHCSCGAPNIVDE